MPRITIKQLQEEIEALTNAYDRAMLDTKEATEELSKVRQNRKMEIKAKDAEIIKLRKHVGFVHAQRDRLVGFIEGRESLTKDDLDVTTRNDVMYGNGPVKIDRTQSFLDSCTLVFDGDNTTVSNDPFRARY